MAANLLLQSDGGMLAAKEEAQSEGGNIWGTPTWALALEHVRAWVKGLKVNWYAAHVLLKQHQREKLAKYKAALKEAKEIGRPPPKEPPLTFPNPTTQDLLEAEIRKQEAMIQGFTQAVSNSRKVLLLPAPRDFALPLPSAASSSAAAAAASSSAAVAAASSPAAGKKRKKGGSSPAAAAAASSSAAAAAASSPAAGKKRKKGGSSPAAASPVVSSPAAGKKRKQGGSSPAAAVSRRSPRNRSKKQGQGASCNLEVMPQAPAQELVGLTHCPAGCGKRRCTSYAGQYRVGNQWLRAQCVNHDQHLNNCTVHDGSQQCRSK